MAEKRVAKEYSRGDRAGFDVRPLIGHTSAENYGVTIRCITAFFHEIG